MKAVERGDGLGLETKGLPRGDGLRLGTKGLPPRGDNISRGGLAARRATHLRSIASL